MASRTGTTLDPDALVAEAAERVEGEVPRRFLPALTRLTEALESEARLTEQGLATTRRALVGALVTQARQRRLASTHPAGTAAAGEEPARADVPPPTFITGMFRTGSTLLQNLLAEHPEVRAPRLWELMAPTAPAGTAAERQALVQAARDYVAEYHTAAPAFRSIHPLDADRPEECHRLTGTTFTCDIYPLRYRVPGYADWLRRQDLTEAYACHRALLGSLLARDGKSRPRHVVLKCPTHLWCLDALAAAYPGARVVRLHRAVRACLPSLCSLTTVVRGARSDAVDPHEIGRYWLRHAEWALSARRLRDKVPAGLRVLDVTYQDLVADPVATAGRVCEFAGIAMTGEARRRMAAFLRDNPAGRHGAHRYAPADFGLDAADLDRRFASYHREFGVRTG